ncbi:unnamed protein product [Adineta ricciae]|uniref:Uncharacterized protein n=1 Tax=Adineta ricciae TaxID=249248 RepID=A0A814H3S4_ADIRI|nr:unnamed protein product [Adineta ricciae]CAF1022072.1 unnamed protein product [Adineta ricciae]
MNTYVNAFKTGLNSLPEDCDLTNMYGRLTRGVNDDDFSRLSHDPTKRLSWVFDHKTLRRLLKMSHLDMLLYIGHTPEWIRCQLGKQHKFKLIVFSAPSDEVKLATWDNIFDLLTKAYPEIDSAVWIRYADELKQRTFQDIDPDDIIVKNYYLGPKSDGFMHLNRFLNLKEPPTLLHVRAFLHNQIGLNELFGGEGKTITHEGNLTSDEYLTRSRPLHDFDEYAVLDLNPVLTA